MLRLLAQVGVACLRGSTHQQVEHARHPPLLVVLVFGHIAVVEKSGYEAADGGDEERPRASQVHRRFTLLSEAERRRRRRRRREGGRRSRRRRRRMEEEEEEEEEEEGRRRRGGGGGGVR